MVSNSENSQSKTSQQDNQTKKKILLAFSGGLDTSAIVPWLIENYNAEVIGYCADLGNAPDKDYLTAWSKRLGISEFIFEDLKDEFTKNYVFPAIKAGAIYQDDYLLGTSLARPLISERIAYFAKKLGAAAIAHGATGKGNDQLRFERSWAYLAPEIEVIAPWKIWSYTGRQDLIQYLASKGIEFENEEKRYSVDVNLLHRSCEGGILENIEAEYNPNEIYSWVATPKALTDNAPTTLTLKFEAGLPVALDGNVLSPSQLLESLNIIAGKNGIGVLDLVEERTIGIKSRGIYETPGGTLLHFALKQLKHACWDRQLLNTARTLGQTYADLVYDGLWHCDTKPALDAFFNKASEVLSGEIGLKIENGKLLVTKRSSPFSLFNSQAVSFETDPEGLLAAAAGYSKVTAFNQKMQGKRNAVKCQQL